MSTPEFERTASDISEYRESSSKLAKKLPPLILPVDINNTYFGHSSIGTSSGSPNSPLKRSTAFYGKGKEKRRQSFLEITSTSPQTKSNPTNVRTETSPASPKQFTTATEESSSCSKVEYVEVLNEVSHPSRVPGSSNSLVDYFEIAPLPLKKKHPQGRLTASKKKRTFSGTTIRNYPQVRSFSGGSKVNIDLVKKGKRRSNIPTFHQSSRLMKVTEIERTTESSKTSSRTSSINVEENPSSERLSVNKPNSRIPGKHNVLRAIEKETDSFSRPPPSQIISSEDEIPPFTPTFGPIRKSYNSDVNDIANSYRVSGISNRSSLPRHPFRDTFGFDKQLSNSVGKVSSLRKSVLKGDLDTVDPEFISYPQRVSSLQNLHKELNKERLSLLGEINELKRISKYLDDTCDDEFIQKIQLAEDRVETFEHLIEQAQKSIQQSPNSSPETSRTRHFDGKGIPGNNQIALTENIFSESSVLSDESINVNMYIPYTLPDTKVSLPNYTYSRIQPLLLDDTPVFKSFLYKLGSNRQWQKREFRIDGFMLVCLEKKKIQVEPKTVILAKYSTANGLQSDPELRKHFYPTNPPLPHISHPLVATASVVGNDFGVDQYVDYYQPPKWVIPLSDILAVTLLARNGFKIRKCFVIHTAERKYILRARTEMETACWVYLLKRMAINRYHEINLLEFSPQSPSVHIDSLVRVNPTNNKKAPNYGTNPDREVVLDQWRSTVNELVRREPSLQRSLHSNTTFLPSPPNQRRHNFPTSRRPQPSRDHTHISSPTVGMQRRKPLPTPPIRANSSPIINPPRIVNQSEA